MKYEIRVEFFDCGETGRSEQRLQALGADGWAVVGVITETLREGGGRAYARIIMQRPQFAQSVAENVRE